MAEKDKGYNGSTMPYEPQALANPTLLQELDFVKQRTALLKQIRRFQKLQRTYMPECTRFLTAAQREIWNEKDRVPEAIKLFLPSEFSSGSHAQVYKKGLDAIEEEMQEAELQESLRNCVRRYTPERWPTGLLRQVAIWILKTKLRPWEKVYHVLNEEDVRGINKQVVSKEEAERERLRELSEIVEGELHGLGCAKLSDDGNLDLVEEHVDHEKRTCNELTKQWAGLHGKAQAYLVGITTDARTEVIVDTEGGDPDDPEGDMQGDELHCNVPIACWPATTGNIATRFPHITVYIAISAQLLVCYPCLRPQTSPDHPHRGDPTNLTPPRGPRNLKKVHGTLAGLLATRPDPSTIPPCFAVLLNRETLQQDGRQSSRRWMVTEEGEEAELGTPAEESSEVEMPDVKAEESPLFALNVAASSGILHLVGRGETPEDQELPDAVQDNDDDKMADAPQRWDR
ncbi:hypothetical protein B0H14DRAFT_3444585 [Mycena olivaceomarginata]|nr:hypothetical protein B0H14DRAFT_3444585 [Mycena olivaceomarginata]